MAGGIMTWGMAGGPGSSQAVEVTTTPTGTTGDQEISTRAGSVNFAAEQSSLIVTNPFASPSSVVLVSLATSDTNMKSVHCVAGEGFFTIYCDNSPAAEARVNFLILS